MKVKRIEISSHYMMGNKVEEKEVSLGTMRKELRDARANEWEIFETSSSFTIISDEWTTVYVGLPS